MLNHKSNYLKIEYKNYKVFSPNLKINMKNKGNNTIT